jgi:hypothetical protein
MDFASWIGTPCRCVPTVHVDRTLQAGGQKKSRKKPKKDALRMGEGLQSLVLDCLRVNVLAGCMALVFSEAKYGRYLIREPPHAVRDRHGSI